MAELVDLSYAECRAALERAPVGRVAVCTPDGPHVIPANYTILDESIIFRTSPFSLLATYGRGRVVAFEVDHLEPDRQRGWSVLARGRAHVVDDHAELSRIRQRARPSPWAGGSRELHLQLVWTTLTGRRVGPRDASQDARSPPAG